jgi:fibronectin type 3 domain-containing protein
VTGTTYTDSSVTDGTTYYYTVEACDSTGDTAPSPESHATPLDAPTISTISAVSAAEIDLTWSSVTGATGYLLSRSLDGSTWSQVSSQSGVTDANTGLSPYTTYYYEVVATAPNSASNPSSSASQTTLLAPPTNLVATASIGKITLTWTASNGAASYKVYRSSTGNNFSLFDSGLTSPADINYGVSNSTAYSYYVTAVDANGNETAASNTATATTPAGRLTAILRLVRQEFL